MREDISMTFLDISKATAVTPVRNSPLIEPLPQVISTNSETDKSNSVDEIWLEENEIIIHKPLPLNS